MLRNDERVSVPADEAEGEKGCSEVRGVVMRVLVVRGRGFDVMVELEDLNSFFAVNAFVCSMDMTFL